MFIIGNLLQAIAEIINLFLTFYMFIIIVSALISWFHVDPYNPLVQMLHQLTEPVLRPIRSHVPFVATGGMDFSPLVVIGICMFIQTFLVSSLRDIAFRLK